MTDHTLRHYCRQDRTKLRDPIDNPHRAFCCRGCFNRFYRSRCVVCERPIHRKNERQRTCINKECKTALRRFPLAYSWPETQKRDNPRSDAVGRNRPSEATDRRSDVCPIGAGAAKKQVTIRFTTKTG
jgi:hypothetical protein